MRRTTTGRAPTAGFTLIEVMIAITILGILTLSLLSANGRMVGTVARDRVQAQAAEAADAQIAQVRLWPDYGTLETQFSGTTNNFPATGWTRVTTITRTGGSGQANDFKRVTVTVTAPGLKTPVSRSVTIAAP
jgi:type II secretion system protein I